MSNREQFLHDLNKAFASNDVEHIKKCVTDNIQWTIVGEDTIKGKTNFAKALREMGDNILFDLQIDDIIIHENKGIVEGILSSHEGKMYAFCDIYTFASSKEPIIEKMVSYVITMARKPLKV